MPEAIALWRYCFRDSEKFTQWYFDRRAGDVLALKGERLISQQVSVPASIDLRGVARSGCIISGVATRPECRGQGLMGRFNGQSYAYLRERGISVAALYPFSYDFYRRYGWAVGCDALKVRVQVERMPKTRASGDFVLVDVHSASGECAAEFAEVYARCFERYSGRVLRDARAFELRLQELALEEGYAALYRYDGAIEGYLLYTIEDRRFAVWEFGAVNARARRDILAYIAGHASTVDEVTWTAPADDLTWRMIPDGRGIATLEPYVMYRILDIPAAMGGLPAGEGEIILKIEDEHARWNARTWRFRAEDGKLTVEPTTDCGAPVLSIGALTQWALGYLDGSGLSGLAGDISPKAAIQMDALLPGRPAFMWEMY